MPEREYELTIAPNGEVELHIKGHKGKGCLDIVKMFETIVGDKKSQQLTSEFYEPEEVVHQHQERRH